MRTESVIDLSFGLNEQAWMVLHAVAFLTRGMDFPEGQDPLIGSDVKTAPWYNGRERGFSIRVRSGIIGSVLTVCFAEHKNSDSIVVYHRVSGGGINPPDADQPKEFWDSEMTFPALGFKKAAEYITSLIEKHLVRKTKEAKNA